jgi:Tfp pilus assembly protein PilO
MGGVRADRLWICGGAIGAVVLLAVGWFFFIAPQRAQTGRLNDQASSAQLRLASLQHRLVDLRQQNSRLPQFRTQLARDREALPTASGLSGYLRQLQTGASRTGVVVSGVVVGSPLSASASGRQVYALPLTLTATGALADLGRFLDQVQQVLPRAALVDSVTAAPEEHSVTLADSVTVTLGVRVFVASTGDAGPAPLATKTN